MYGSSPILGVPSQIAESAHVTASFGHTCFVLREGGELMTRCHSLEIGEYSHHRDGVVVKDCGNIFRGKLVGRVADKKTSLPYGTVADDHTPVGKVFRSAEGLLMCDTDDPAPSPFLRHR